MASSEAMDYASVHRALRDEDDAENLENLQWFLPSIRETCPQPPQNSPKTPLAMNDNKTRPVLKSMKRQRKRKAHERKVQRHRMRVEKRAKILFE